MKQQSTRRCSLWFLFVLLCLGSVMPLRLATAAIRSYTGPFSEDDQDDLWSHPMIWNAVGILTYSLPQAGDTVNIVNTSDLDKKITFDITNNPAFGAMMIDHTGDSGSMTLAMTHAVDCNLTAGALCIGYEGTGMLDHTLGTNTVMNTLLLGNQEGSIGTYDLHVHGDLITKNTVIGLNGTGVFNHYVESIHPQYNPTHTVSNELVLGRDYSALGACRRIPLPAI